MSRAIFVLYVDWKKSSPDDFFETLHFFTSSGGKKRGFCRLHSETVV